MNHKMFFDVRGPLAVYISLQLEGEPMTRRGLLQTLACGLAGSAMLVTAITTMPPVETKPGAHARNGGSVVPRDTERFERFHNNAE